MLRCSLRAARPAGWLIIDLKVAWFTVLIPTVPPQQKDTFHQLSATIAALCTCFNSCCTTIWERHLPSWCCHLLINRIVLRSLVLRCFHLTTIRERHLPYCSAIFVSVLLGFAFIIITINFIDKIVPLSLCYEDGWWSKGKWLSVDAIMQRKFSHDMCSQFHHCCCEAHLHRARPLI